MNKRDPENPIFNLRIKLGKKGRPIGQVYFAKKLGVSQGTIAKWENEYMSPTAEALFRIMENFGKKAMVEVVEYYGNRV